MRNRDLTCTSDRRRGVGVLAAEVAENEAERLDACAEAGDLITGLLDRPLRGGVGGDASDMEPAGTVFEERRRV
ncbi:predicted protein [Streptomyces viridosporus ATCC 14672]|uniref:Predicted protein n=1 Tax=Streptomyces viridosporus (strain ATCC 14672 / DSM 40746 / JCM 4963 / KCTC 9882 / NRRL B-12104 / FH 1290) TaxID=566461 RepID=D5ZU88_STRV1|nr:predicted protein [Streptomyces viridosporus ATCC 14672]